MQQSEWEQRLETLESKLAFQEMTIDQLNSAVVQHELEMNKMREQMRILTDKLKANAPSIVASQSEGDATTALLIAGYLAPAYPGQNQNARQKKGHPRVALKGLLRLSGCSRSRQCHNRLYPDHGRGRDHGRDRGHDDGHLHREHGHEPVLPAWLRG
ncbi:phi X174 lysis protein [Pantoea agglomerans]|uniref:Phi X174 lysis protein n=1 Tax=Enterobacter agglomerans TaxID=549 RepID=A0A379A9Y8_ENTAG|nr:phi X174 lysis protein [Pantoea agglomerans]